MLLDSHVFLWFNSFAGSSPLVDAAMRLMVSDYLILVVLCLALLGLWFGGKDARTREVYQRAALTGISAVGLANLAVLMLNVVWPRARPFVEHPDEVTLLFYPATDPSFPANAVTVAFAVAGAVWIGHRRLGAAMLGAAGLFGMARLYAGVSWPSDIIGGALIGLAVTLATWRLRQLLEPLPSLAIRLARAVNLG